MQIQRVCTLAELNALADRWNQLSRNVPFRRCEWNSAWWRHYGHGHELFVLGVYDRGARLVGLAPWYLEQSSGAGRVIRFLGSGEVCSDYTSLLIEPGEESSVTTAIVQWLAGAESVVAGGSPDSRWDLLELGGIDSEDDAITALALRFASGEFKVHERPGVSCWRIPLPGTWDEYLAMLSKPNRRRVRWAEKRLRESGDCQARIVGNGEEFEFAWRALVELHQRRRSSLGQPGCFASEPFGRFLHDVAEQFLHAGMLHMVWIERAGRPIAAGLNFCGSGVTYAYQVGIDPQSLDENPGWLVNTASVQHAIASGQQGFDLLRGDEPYKGHLRAQPRPSKELRIVPNRLRSQLWHTAWRTGSTMKDWLRSSLALAGIRSP
jgi:CelD/BcsL family acetyltransferase involved in cellulose biosynthesis